MASSVWASGGRSKQQQPLNRKINHHLRQRCVPSSLEENVNVELLAFETILDGRHPVDKESEF